MTSTTAAKARVARPHLSPTLVSEIIVTLGVAALAIAAALVSPETFSHTWLPLAGEWFVALWTLVSLGLMVWRPRWGFLVALPALIAPLGATNAFDLAIVAVALLMACAQGSRWWILGATALAAVELVLRAPLNPQPVSVYGTASTMWLCAVTGGVLVRQLEATQAKNQGRIVALRQANLDARAEERANLARELHDLVAHQLSIVSLQIMGHKESHDPDQLALVLARVGVAAQSALSELRVLVGVMGSPPHDRSDLEEAPVTTEIARLRDILLAADHPTVVAIDPDVDDLEGTIRWTLVRLLRESVTNILKHGPDGGECQLRVQVSTDEVHVEVVSPFGSPRRIPSPGGLGLRGLHERVNLSGGSLEAGRRGREWVVVATLPRA